MLVGLDWPKPMMFLLLCTSHAHTFSCIHSLHSVYFYIFELFGAFLIVSFFPLSLLFTLVMSMALKRKSALS